MIPATTIILRNGYVKTELTGKFPHALHSRISLVVPLPAYPIECPARQDGKVINGLILQRPYWFRYM